jgi:hypothetical protein
MDFSFPIRFLLYGFAAIGAYFLGRRLSKVFRTEWMNHALVLALAGTLAVVLYNVFGETLKSRELLYADNATELVGRAFLILAAPALYGVYRGRRGRPFKGSPGS